MKEILTEDDAERLIKKIYNGKVNINKLPELVYTNTALILSEGVTEGAEMAFEWGRVDKALVKELMENIYIFSGAKTATQVEEISAMLTDGKNVLSYSDFRVKALEKFKLYNETYLRTEYITAVGQSNQACRWQQIEKQAKALPYLTYSAVMDKNTSDECRHLDGITLPVEHKFWRTHSPLRHFRCRCVLLQEDEYGVKVTSESKVKEMSEKADKNVNPMFKHNAGMTKVVFTNEHPYFDIADKYPKQAKKNFGLPI